MHTKIDPNVRKMVTIILLVSTFISLMSQTMMITALPVIQHDVHRSLNTVQWLTTGYTLMIGVITPLSSNLYECFTNRQVFLGTLGTFIAGTLLGCVATSFGMLLAARLIQACAGGMLMSFQITTMISIYPPEKRGSILGLSSLVIAAGPAIGPSTAGLDPTFFKLALPLYFGAPLHGVGLCTGLLHAAQLLNAPPHSHRLLFGGHLFDWFRPDPRFFDYLHRQFRPRLGHANQRAGNFNPLCPAPITANQPSLKG